MADQTPAAPNSQLVALLDFLGQALSKYGLPLVLSGLLMGWIVRQDTFSRVERQANLEVLQQMADALHSLDRRLELLEQRVGK